MKNTLILATSSEGFESSIIIENVDFCDSPLRFVNIFHDFSKCYDFLRFRLSRHFFALRIVAVCHCRTFCLVIAITFEVLIRGSRTG